MVIMLATGATMLRVDDVMEYISGDFGCPMRDVLTVQKENWTAYKRGQMSRWEMHDSELTHGGPLMYIKYLAAIMRRERSWIGPPLDVEIYEDSRYVTNGHHRFVASVMNGMEFIPGSIEY